MVTEVVLEGLEDKIQAILKGGISGRVLINIHKEPWWCEGGVAPPSKSNIEQT